MVSIVSFSPAVLANTAALAIFAPAFLPAVLANTAALAIFANAFMSAVLANTAALAIFAMAFLPAVLAESCCDQISNKSVRHCMTTESAAGTTKLYASY